MIASNLCLFLQVCTHRELTNVWPTEQTQVSNAHNYQTLFANPRESSHQIYTNSTVTNVALHSLKYDTAVRGLRLNMTGSVSH